MIPTKETLKLKAFHGDKSLKSALVKEIKWHKAQDKIIQGTYETDGKYCAVGCSIHSLNVKKGTTFSPSDHTIYETQLGIPESLARLEDLIFEGLPKDKCADFPLKFIQAIPVGANLAMVAPKFIIFVLNDCLKNAEPDGVKAITTVIKLWSSVVAGKNPKQAAWSAAGSAARSAESAARSAESAAGSAESAARSAESAAGSAESAAGSAAWSAARSAAWSAAGSAESAAGSAAWSAARSAAWSAAWSAARSAAWSAESAAGSAAWSAARSAAWSAAWSAARSAAWSAAWSAARSAAWSAARSAAYGRYANHLIKLLKECK
jgi:hypothetical protein